MKSVIAVHLKLRAKCKDDDEKNENHAKSSTTDTIMLTHLVLKSFTNTGRADF